AKRQLFPAPVVQEIHRVTNGVPRLINTVCDNVLLEMFFAKRRVADIQIVQQIALNFGLPDDMTAQTHMPPPLPIEEQLALEGTFGHDAIVSIGREGDAPQIEKVPPVVPPLSAEANIIAQRIAEEATPVPVAVDEPTDGMTSAYAASDFATPSYAERAYTAPYDNGVPGLADALEPEPAAATEKPLPSFEPPARAEIPDPLAFLHDAPRYDLEGVHKTGRRDETQSSLLANARAQVLDDEPILLETVVDDAPLRPPVHMPAIMEVTDSQIQEMPHFDIEVVEDGHSLGFGEGMQPLRTANPLPAAAPSPSSASLPPSSEAGVPLARITPVTRTITAEPSENASTNGIKLGSTPSAPVRPAPLKTTNGRTIDLAEIDDLLADISNLTKK
ncbi:MAG: hypothetical protein H7Z43_08780, partial [Clostridia bacterium]|nr:hypothetical protein [Deltaproteobacteria bacterium]